MAKKDPAFLMYSKDWLQGTSHMTPDEKGIYIDFLCHQHQDGSIPSDIKRLAKMVGLSEAEFLPIWSGIKSKFKSNSDNRLVNHKLIEITTDRSSKGIKNTITGIFASLIRLNHLSDEIRQEMKKNFKIDDFIDFPKEILTEQLTIWFHGRLKSIEDGNEDCINRKGVRGEGWCRMPGPESFGLELPEIKSGAAMELYYFTHKKRLTKEEIIGLWEIFKKQTFTGQKFYERPEDTFSHFINWIKNQKTNGVDVNGVNQNGKSAAAHKLANRALGVKPDQP
jgi:Protein of unknown function (DUF1376)